MKKILLLLIIPAVLLTMLLLSCKQETAEPSKPYSELIVGRWMTEDEGYFEEYLSDGNAKYWVPAEDIPEEGIDIRTKGQLFQFRDLLVFTADKPDLYDFTALVCAVCHSGVSL